MDMEFLKKVKSLAERGVGGEKENAEVLLRKLMEKYNVTEEELSDDVESWYEIEYHGRFERDIVLQCIAKVKADAKGYKTSGKWNVKCTKAEFIEMNELCVFYRRALQEDLDIFLRAFIHKHDLYPETSSGPRHEPTREELEQLMKVLELVGSMPEHEYLKRIEAPK